MNSEVIGPFTPEEWCAFRQTGEDDDILQCCGESSDLRDDIFQALRMGGDFYGNPFEGPGRLLRLKLEEVHFYCCLEHPLLDKLYTYLGGDVNNWQDSSEELAEFRKFCTLFDKIEGTK